MQRAVFQNDWQEIGVAKEFAKCDENDGFLPKRISSSKFILNGREALLDFELAQKQNCILLDVRMVRIDTRRPADRAEGVGR
jgi:hypothetical protein